jgi:hydrogenase nickel incorporation protein HypA/HybF
LVPVNCGSQTNEPMHELAVTQDVLNIVLRHAEANKALKVVRVQLRIGELRDILDEWMQRMFDLLSRKTIAEGAKLVIERIPVAFRCECGETFSINIRETVSKECPDCGGQKTALCTGREFDIVAIEVL